MGLSASSLARAYIEGEEVSDQSSNFQANDSGVKRNESFQSPTLNSENINNNTLYRGDRSNKRWRDENQNHEKVNNRNTDSKIAKSRKDTLSITSLTHTPSSNKGSILDNTDHDTPRSIFDDNDLDVEGAHECVVIVGDKDFDLLHRLARIEARMNAMDEERGMIKRLMDKDSIIDNLKNQLKVENEAWVKKEKSRESKIIDLEELVQSLTGKHDQNDIDKIKAESDNQKIRLENEVVNLKEQKKVVEQNLKDKDYELKLCKEEAHQFKVSKEAELESYKKVLDECEKLRSDLWYKYDAAIQLLQKTRSENSKTTSERHQVIKKSVSTTPLTPRGPSKLPSMFHTGINQNIERVEGMIKRIVVKNGKRQRLRGDKKEVLGGSLSVTRESKKKIEKGSSQEKVPLIRDGEKSNRLGLQRSKTRERTLVSEAQLRTTKRFQHRVQSQDIIALKSNKLPQSAEGLKVKTSKNETILALPEDSIKPDKRLSASPQEHSVASLLKRHSLTSSRRQDVSETEVVKKIMNKTDDNSSIF